MTVVAGTSFNGTWAHPVSGLGDRQLTRGEAATLSGRGLFGYDSAALTDTAKRQLRDIAHRLRLARVVVCEGYADYAGTVAHETMLSRERATVVCDALQHYGAHVQLRLRAYGPRHPVVVGGTAHRRAANRRVVIRVAS